MRLARHAAQVGERESAYKISVGNPEGKEYLGDLGVDMRTI
jgi:hypothetical protein